MLKGRNLDIQLVSVNKSDSHAKILFETLKKRKNKISHDILPSYADHKTFVLNHPYRAWYIIKADDEIVGNAYLLKNNCVGISIVKNSRRVTPAVIEMILNKHKPLKAIKSVRPGNFIFNVSPNSKDYIHILEQMGARLVQMTFAFDKNMDKVSAVKLG